MKTLTFEQMEQVNGGIWKYLNPIPTNPCNFALGSVGGIYTIMALAVGGPIAGATVFLITTVAANYVCDY